MERRARAEMERRKKLGLQSATARGSPRYLTWQVLPPGHWRHPVVQNETGSLLNRDDVAWRLQFLDSLSPLQWYRGSHLSLAVYYVAEFPNVAIADTSDYGHALYYCLRGVGDWKRVFQFDKQEAQKAGARRIIHTGDWEERVRRLVGK